MENIKGLAQLERNIEETIFEGQVKLGYIKEKMNIYYMEPSLAYLLKLNTDDSDSIKHNIVNFKKFAEERLGDIKVTVKNNRYCFTISEKGVEYIYKSNRKNNFLSDLINVLADKNCSLDDVLKVFKRKSEEIICEESSGSEFDYVIYYKDENIDIFRYCFSFNELGAYYHRFIPFDYESIL